MTTQIEPNGQMSIADEIIDNAMGLPVESQDLILMMAKAMRYTKDLMMREDRCPQSCKTLE